jgi:2,3-dihydro-2,3-dihydroxybenzoate dehydrogenase
VFAQAGASIAAFDVQDTSETVEVARREGAQAKGWVLDARSEDAVGAAVDEVEKKLGPIHVLVNLAGVVGSRPLLMENFKNIMNTMEINFGGVFQLSKRRIIVDDAFYVEGFTTHEAKEGRYHHQRGITSWK